MQNAPLYTALLLLLCTCAPSQKEEAPENQHLAPTEITEGIETEGHGEARRAYEKQLHAAAPGTDWQRLEEENALARHRKRRANPAPEKSLESFAGGLLQGEWHERGAGTVTGAMHDVVQHPTDPNLLYILADGGSLWLMNYGKRTFGLINHDVRLNNEYLKLVETDAGHNLMALTTSRPAYSTDYGKNWEIATVYADGEDITGVISSHFSPTVLGRDVYVYLEARSRGVAGVFRSRDGGVTYEQLPPVAAQVDLGGFSISHLLAPEGTDCLFLLYKRQYQDAAVRLLEIIPDGESVSYEELATLEGIDTDEFYRARVTAATQPNGQDRIYVQAHHHLFRSNNSGATWREMPQLDDVPWRYESIYVRPSDPDFVAWGAVELWVSRNGGETFRRPNRWYDYYQDTDTYLHADIMSLQTVTDWRGEERVIVSSHGGLNELNEDDGMWYNIAPDLLHTAQYYDIATSPVDPTFIVAGSQDQGLQVLQSRAEDSHEIMAGEQINSGDFGHLQFSPDGNVLYANYPYGLVIAFHGWEDGDVDDYVRSRYTIESDDEFLWIQPSMLVPDAGGGHTYYQAGGSATGGEGSFLIETELEEDPDAFNYGELTAWNKPFDFIDAGGGQLSALSYSPLNTSRFYAATTQGRFFTSNDRGETWEQTLNFLPDGWYLYGQAIHASKTDEETVWLAGSGYSNPPVFRSTDGGENFFPASDGLPPTTVIGLASNADESLLFAATESGPFVYVASEERWFDLTGQFAPTQRFTAVEFIEDQNVARFATYGRGVWDLQVEQLMARTVSNNNLGEAAGAELVVKLAPNPAAEVVTISGGATGYRVIDGAGRELSRVIAVDDQARVDVREWTTGMYFVQGLDEAGRPTGLPERLMVR